jgi:hypothetical protein
MMNPARFAACTVLRHSADPRCLAFLRKLGYAPEQFAKIEFKVTLPAAEGAMASGAANH